MSQFVLRLREVLFGRVDAWGTWVFVVVLVPKYDNCVSSQLVLLLGEVLLKSRCVRYMSLCASFVPKAPSVSRQSKIGHRRTGGDVAGVQVDMSVVLPTVGRALGMNAVPSLCPIRRCSQG